MKQLIALLVIAVLVISIGFTGGFGKNRVAKTLDPDGITDGGPPPLSIGTMNKVNTDIAMGKIKIAPGVMTKIMKSGDMNKIMKSGDMNKIMKSGGGTHKVTGIMTREKINSVGGDDESNSVPIKPTGIAQGKVTNSGDMNKIMKSGDATNKVMGDSPISAEG